MKRIIVFVLLISLFLCGTAFAKPQIYTATGEYVMSPKETLDDGIKHAREDALRLISESVGVYVESQSEAKNQELTRDEIKTMSASIIRVVSESGPVIIQHGKGLDIKMTVTAEADTDQLFIEQEKKNKDLDKKLQSAQWEAGTALDAQCMTLALREDGESGIKSCIVSSRLSQNPWVQGYAEKWDGIMHLRQKKYNDALNSFDKAIEIFSGIHDKWGFGEEEELVIRTNAADICAYFCKDAERAQDYLREVKIRQKLDGAPKIVVPEEAYNNAEENIRRLKAGEDVTKGNIEDNDLVIFGNSPSN